jgi:hypothetical protein
MSEINPAASTPTTTQSVEYSDRNPPVANWGGTDAEGGLVPSPPSAAGRVTEPGAAVSPNAGLTDYDTAVSADSVEDEAERED